MKKFYLASLVLVALAAGCQDNDFEAVSGETAKLEGNLIELGDNFLVASVDAGAETRTHWDGNPATGMKNHFLPTWTGGGINDVMAGHVTSDAIGLCWTGVAADGTGASGDEVLTNYQFNHFGWLETGATAAEFDLCGDTLTNGWTYDKLKIKQSVTGGNEMVVADVESDAGYTPAWGAGAVDLNSGVYRTENKAIFGGKYVAYYPYDSTFCEKGMIPVSSPVAFDTVKVGTNGITAPSLGAATFRISKVFDISGGARASEFSMKPLSGLVAVNVVTTGTSKGTVAIDTIILQSTNKSFLKSARLKLSAIAASDPSTSAYSGLTGADSTKTIRLGMQTAFEAGEKNSKTQYVTAALLPTTVSDLKVLIHGKTTDNKSVWATVSYGALTVRPGTATMITVTANDADFKENVFYAYDCTSLRGAKWAALAASNDGQTKSTVTVLGDIVIDKNLSLGDDAANTSGNKYPDAAGLVTFEGDDLIVKEGVSLTICGGAIVKNNIIIEGESCCSNGGATAPLTNAGQAVIRTCKLEGDITVKAGYPGKANGDIIFGDRGNFNWDVRDTEAYSTAMKSNTWTIEEGCTVTVIGDSDLKMNGTKASNKGTITVYGGFAVLDASGSTTAAAGRNFVNEVGSTFIDKLSSTVGGASGYMINKGDYICEVDGQNRLNTAYNTKLACNIIDIKKQGQYSLNPKKHNHYNADGTVAEQHVDIWVSANDVIIERTSAATEVNIGKLTVKPDGASAGGVEIRDNLTVNGDVVNNGNVEFKCTTKTENDVTYYNKVTIKGDLVDNGTLTVGTGIRNMKVEGDIVEKGTATYGENVINLTAANVTIYNGASATYAARGTDAVTVNVAGTYEVKAGGTFTLNVPGADQTVAVIQCRKLVEGGTFVNGKPDVVE